MDSNELIPKGWTELKNGDEVLVLSKPQPGIPQGCARGFGKVVGFKEPHILVDFHDVIEFVETKYLVYLG